MCARASRSRAVRHRARQPLLDEPHALERDAVGDRVIEPARSRPRGCATSASMPVAAVIVRRQADRQLRIRDHDRRQHLRMEDDLLRVVAQVGDHRRRGRPRSRCRRWSAPRRSAPCRRRSTRVHQSSRSSKSQIGRVCPTMSAMRLAGVERAAAAEGDDAVVPPVAIGAHAGVDVRLARDSAHVREDRARAGPPSRQRRRAAFVRLIGSWRRGPDRSRAAAAHAERRRRRRGSSRMRPSAEADRGRVVPVALERRGIGGIEAPSGRTRRWKDFGRVSCS